MIRKLLHDEIQSSKPSLEAVRSLSRTPLIVVLDNIRSLHNVGAIFRTCDGILAERLFLCGITGYPPRKEIAKVALGATEVVPWEYSPSTEETVRTLKDKGVKICLLELCKESVDFKSADYSFPMALIVGNEVEGISDDIIKMADMAVSIKMLGRANSLNVATAFGITAYEILHCFCQTTDENNM